MPGWLGVVGAGIGAAAALGLVAAYARTQWAAGLLNLKDKRIAALQDQLTDTERQLELMEERVDSTAAHNIALDHRNRELVDMVTGRPELEDLRRALEHHTAELRADHERFNARFDALLGRAVRGDPPHDHQAP